MKHTDAHIHPHLQPIVRRIPRITYSKRTGWIMNIAMRLARFTRAPAGIHTENTVIAGPDARPLRLRIYRPAVAATPAPVLLWMHGGGYIIGTPEQDDAVCAYYVRETGITVVSVDYRYGAKNPFPAALNDCYAALQWVSGQGPHMGMDAARIMIGGASAGAGLAASLVHLAHDRQEIAPIMQLLVYPMLDDRTVQQETDGRDYIAWNRASNRYGWETYLGQSGGEPPAYAVSARRSELAGLPPAWIGVGTADLFYDEDRAYAERLDAAGVACTFVPVPGAFHGFDVFSPDLPLVQAFRQSQIDALKQAIAR